MIVYFGLFAFLTVLQLGSTSDVNCTIQGGTCVDYRYYVCNAGVETDLCDGESNRRCCLECNSTCVSNEDHWRACCDSECTNAKGKCQDDSNYCSGYYSGETCGNPSKRKCCMPVSGTGCYGNIDDVPTTGASPATASEDKLPYSGVPASHEMAARDLNAMGLYRSKIKQAASELCVDPAVIAGIISRETRAGRVLGPDGFGYDGHGYGLMQVDNRYHVLQGGPYSIENIRQGTGILIGMINGVRNEHQDWTTDMSLKGGICAYNSGVFNVQTYAHMDIGTTGNDYSNDVTARSQYYKANGY